MPIDVIMEICHRCNLETCKSLSLTCHHIRNATLPHLKTRGTFHYPKYRYSKMLDVHKLKYVTSVTKLHLFKNITEVTFSQHFNKPITICLPATITHVTFGRAFNQPIKGIIPNSVTHLTFGESFNQSIKDVPDSVTHLVIGHSFNFSQELHIPPSVQHLTLPRFTYLFYNHIIPPTITKFISLD